jgi:hypothetical protein
MGVIATKSWTISKSSIFTDIDVTSSTFLAISTVLFENTPADFIANSESLDVFPHSNKSTNNFVARYDWILRISPVRVDSMDIRLAHSSPFHSNSDLLISESFKLVIDHFNWLVRSKRAPSTSICVFFVY